MVVYTRDNIEGIVLKTTSGNKYKVIKSLPKIHLKNLNSSWESIDYSLGHLLENLNNGNWKVIEQPTKIYELW